MKTKDLIKLLQEADPSGECHVRISKKPVCYVDHKPGYWDGPYNYLEKGEDGKYTWVQSTKGDKVDLQTIDLFTFAESFDGNWEEMEKHIRVEYDYLDEGKREREFLKLAKEECIEYNKVMESVRKLK